MNKYRDDLIIARRHVYQSYISSQSKGLIALSISKAVYPESATDCVIFSAEYARISESANIDYQINQTLGQL